MEPQHTTGGKYLLTEDLGEKVSAFRQVGLVTPSPSDELFESLQDRLAAALQTAIGASNAVVRVKMRDLSDEIISAIAHTWGNDVLVVSTCPEIGQPTKGTTIEVNRLVDKLGNALGLGPRPGYGPLKEQFYAVVHEARSNDQRIVIAEDGVFKGETMRYVVNGIQDVGGDVAGVMTGFTFSRASVDEIADHGVKVDVIHDFGAILDWVPDHDFLPFTPGSGKVLGTAIGDRLYPFYDHLHSTFSMSYIAPFAPVEQWASIPPANINSFSTTCIGLAIELFTELERINKRKIVVGDIVESRQRVSIPVSLDHEDTYNGPGLPGRDSRVITFLSECL